jgi:hypothetical protein
LYRISISAGSPSGFDHVRIVATGPQDYISAISMFERSAVEALKTVESGDDTHLLRALRSNREGSSIIGWVGARFRPDEHSLR